MRSYPLNSPEAAARIVSLALVADGHVSQAELEALDRAGVGRTLGLDRQRLHEVLQDFCEDLLQAHHGQWAEVAQVDASTLNQLLAEIDDPALRSAVLNLCVKVAEADAHIAEGEALVLVTAVEQWDLRDAMLAPVAS